MNFWWVCSVILIYFSEFVLRIKEFEDMVIEFKLDRTKSHCCGSLESEALPVYCYNVTEFHPF